MNVRIGILIFIFAIARGQSHLPQTQQIFHQGQNFISPQNQQLLQEQQQHEREEVRPSLQQWVAEQLQNTRNFGQFPSDQSFAVFLMPQESKQFKWIPKSKKKTLNLLAEVITFNQKGDLSLAQNPPQSEHIRITGRDSEIGRQVHLGNAYVSKILQIEFISPYKLISFENKCSDPMIVNIELEGDPFKALNVSDSVADKSFKLSAQKLLTIQEQMKRTDVNRNHMFKWEWGFLEKQERHQEQLLRLTGAQLFVILVTAIVQMYCIKSLLDNNQVI